VPLNNNGEPLLGGGSGTSHPPPHASSDILINPHSPSHHTQHSSSHHQTSYSPVKHRKRRLKSSVPTFLPPLTAAGGHHDLHHQFHQSASYHGSQNTSARTTVSAASPSKGSKRALRVHTVPASMVLHTATVGAPSGSSPGGQGGPGQPEVGGGPTNLLPSSPAKSPLKKQRPHSASQHGGGDSSRSVLLSPLHHHHHPYSPSAERHQRRKQKQLAHLATKAGPSVGMSPEKYRTINKVETVRILRARPAFYPVAPPSGRKHKSKHHSSSHHHTSYHHHQIHHDNSSRTEHDLDLPSNVLGKHITLGMDRAGDLKRKRKSPVPSTNLQTAANQ